MARMRFLQRLRYRAVAKEEEEPTPEELLKSVVDHVSKILNTRKGSSVLADDLGIPDFTGLGTDFSLDKIPDMERTLTDFISKYEPRLSDISVHFRKESIGKMQMTFYLSANIHLERSDQAVHLVTEVNPQGNVTVSS